MAEERLANLRFSSDIEEILERVPRSTDGKRRLLTRAKCGLIFGRLGLNFFKIYKDFENYSAPGLWTGAGIMEKLTTVLPFIEIVVYIFIVCSGAWGIAQCYHLDPKLPYIPENNRRWRLGALGAVRLQGAAGFSALKLLDAFRTVVPETQARWELMLEQHSKRWRALLSATLTLAFQIGRGIVGVVAFGAKVRHCAEPASLVQYLGFANQVIHIADAKGIQKDSVMSFMFTGEDAKWSLDEVEALREFEGRVLKRCVRHAADKPSGFTTYALLQANDVQKMIVAETSQDGGRRA